MNCDVFDIERIAFGSIEGGRIFAGLGGDLLDEQIERFLAGPADLFVNAGGPGLHLFIHPATAPLAVNDANAFADGVEDQVGLLGNHRAFQRQEIGGVGKDGAELVAAEGLDGLVDGGDFAHVAEAAKCVDNRGVGLGLTGKNENFFTTVIYHSSLAAVGSGDSKQDVAIRGDAVNGIYVHPSGSGAGLVDGPTRRTGSSADDPELQGEWHRAYHLRDFRDEDHRRIAADRGRDTGSGSFFRGGSPVPWSKS